MTPLPLVGFKSVWDAAILNDFSVYVETKDHSWRAVRPACRGHDCDWDEMLGYLDVETGGLAGIDVIRLTDVVRVTIDGMGHTSGNTPMMRRSVPIMICITTDRYSLMAEQRPAA